MQPNGERLVFYTRPRHEAQDKVQAALNDLGHGLALPNLKQSTATYLPTWI